VVGCGSVSEHYLNDLKQCPYAEVVSLCDVERSRAEARARQFGVGAVFGSVVEALAGPELDLLVNLTSMPSHYGVNLAALEAGKPVLCEKPLSTRLEQGRELMALARQQGVRLYGAPTTTLSPAFRDLARLIASGELGQVVAAHARYGHPGPSWGPWFYGPEGGCLFDLGVYNVTTLTGLLGPVRSVAAVMGTVVPEREVEGQRVQVASEDNAALLMDHDNGCTSCLQTGFTYASFEDDWTLEVLGRDGSAYLLGYDWAPQGVGLRMGASLERRGENQGGYRWQGGASYLAECLATGREPMLSGEHALHVLEVMVAAKRSAAEGRRVAVESRFALPSGDSPYA
jgi:predicted dehydrogenase